MIIVPIFVIALILILLITSRKEKLSKKYDESKITMPFYKAGAKVYRKAFGKESNFYYQKIFDKNSLIYAPKENREITTEYFVEKLGLCILALFVGMIFVAILECKGYSETKLVSGNSIRRGDYLDSPEEIYLDADVDGEELVDIPVKIEEMKYSKDEFDAAIPEYETLLEKEFLGENESLDRVNRKVELVDCINEYPFSVEWKVANKEYIDYEGNLSDEIPDAGTIVNVTAIISYEEYEAEYSFFIHVYPKELSRKDIILKKIDGLLEESQEENFDSEYYVLPSNVDGMEIKWKEKKVQNTLIFSGLVLLLVVGIFFGKDMDLDKKIQKRNEQMMEDYAEIISKLTLYVGAGMSVIHAWKKIANDYQAKKEEGSPVHFAYEEMTYTMYEMESGIEENRCYQHFADRVKVQKYVKLVSLLEQNIKMGTKGLIEDLKKEAEDAFIERKNMAEKKGEEAGTKLLLPMFMMLLIVMVVIMIPAFKSM